jgi:tRNA modification GTPase
MIPFSDTICAPASAPGTGALAVIRISGPESLRVVSSLFPLHGKLVPRRAVHGTLSHDGTPLDDAVLMYYQSPASFTGEDSVEITCHGNPIIVRNIIHALCACGARLAQPGEFTKRAFLNGKTDLTGAEAINSIITAKSGYEIDAAIKQMHGSLRDKVNSIRHSLITLKADIECSIDFAAEDIEFVSSNDAAAECGRIKGIILDTKARCELGQKVSRGVDLPLIGKPNAGKSSILNLILNSERAIVSDIPGTTRDIIRETIQFGGVHVNLTDTAGIRESDSKIEQIGIHLSEKALHDAGIAIMVLDCTTGLTDDDRDIIAKFRDQKIVYAANKCDTAPDAPAGIASDLGEEVIPFSTITGQGLPELEEAVSSYIRNEFEGKEFFTADDRIVSLLSSAATSCDQAITAFREKAPYEITAAGVQTVIDNLSEITGQISPDEVLDSIFARFCIGK